jgi:hypothetical protein
MKINNSSIRSFILRNPDHLRATIRRDGRIIVKTNKQRGDGGPIPWAMYWGDVSDAVDMIKADASR